MKKPTRTVLCASPDAELATELAKLVKSLCKLNTNVTSAFDSTGEAIASLSKNDVLIISEQYHDLIKDYRGNVVVLCRQECADYFLLKHEVLITPFSNQQLINMLVKIGLLKANATANSNTSKLLGQSDAIQSLRKKIAQYAPTKHPVHIHGESGTGKELVAREIHQMSGRTGDFIPVNCGAMSDTLLESELFGHKKGAFTGADSERKGLIEAADGGTLFLDEVGDMPASLQVKLLRVLQEGTIRPVGGNKEVSVDVRIISATLKSLPDLVMAKVFREDLFYRLNVLRLSVPSLRDRMDDIPLLVSSLTAKKVSDDAISLLKQQYWHGNIRELQAVLIRAEIVSDGEINEDAIIDSLEPPITSPKSAGENNCPNSGEDKAIFRLVFENIPTLEEVKFAYLTELKRISPKPTNSELQRLSGLSKATLCNMNKLLH